MKTNKFFLALLSGLVLAVAGAGIPLASAHAQACYPQPDGSLFCPPPPPPAPPIVTGGGTTSGVTPKKHKKPVATDVSISTPTATATLAPTPVPTDAAALLVSATYGMGSGSMASPQDPAGGLSPFSISGILAGPLGWILAACFALAFALGQLAGRNRKRSALYSTSEIAGPLPEAAVQSADSPSIEDQAPGSSNMEPITLQHEGARRTK